MAESVRISANSITNGIKEVSKGKALIKQGEKQAGQEFIKRGSKRLGAFMAVAGAGAKGAESVSKAWNGLGADEVEAIKDVALADYMQNSNVIHINLFYQAGISSEMLILALEPEAASVFCKRELGIVKVPVGCRYMVLDLGGKFIYISL